MIRSGTRSTSSGAGAAARRADQNGCDGGIDLDTA